MTPYVGALTLTQPWATLVAINAKRLETRDWPTQFRGRLLISASKKFPQECRELCTESPFREVLEAAGYLRVHGKKETDLPLACVVATSRLIDCRRTELASECGFFDGCGDHEAAFGDYGPERYAFTLDRVQRLHVPVPCRGMLNIWRAPNDLVQQVVASLQRQLVEAAQG